MEPIGLGMQVPLLNLLVIMEVEDLICVVFFLLGILVISVHTRMCIGYVQCKYDAICVVYIDSVVRMASPMTGDAALSSPSLCFPQSSTWSFYFFIVPLPPSLHTTAELCIFEGIFIAVK
jgi:hypothetical protein